MEILKIPDLRKAKVLSRPSKICKTPYVADIILQNQDNEIFDEGNVYQAHCPSLGCCGLCEKESIVFVAPMENKNKKVCSFVVYLALFEERNKNYEEIVGIHPKTAEIIVEKCLENNLLSKVVASQFKREVKLMNSRFDFVGKNMENESFVLEVKNVPLADYADCTAKDRKKMDFSDKQPGDKISYFPDGYRKKKGAVVSPRALKHIQELEALSLEGEYKSYICYVIQRTDSSSFQPSILDPIYSQAVKKAVESGVEIITIGVRWTKDGVCRFERDNYIINNV